MMTDPFEPKDRTTIFRERKERMKVLYDQHVQRFPTDEDCIRELVRRGGDDKSWICPHCKTHDPSVRFIQRSTNCRNCGKKSWHTAGTLFSHIKRPRPWLFAIELMEKGEVISSNCLHEIAEVAQSTAHNIQRKLRMVIERNMEEDVPSESSASFISVVCKRSLETPARCHPTQEEWVARRESTVAEDGINEQVDNGTVSDSSASPPVNAQATSDGEPDGDSGLHADGPGDLTMEQMETLTDDQKCVYRALGLTPISLDELIERTNLAANDIAIAITGLELEQLATTIGAKFARCRPKTARTRHASSRDVQSFLSKLNEGATSNSNANYSNSNSNLGHGSGGESDLQATVARFLEFARDYYHGISRKYLQHYVFAFWCHIRRDRWGPDSLRVACLRSAWITDDEVLAYVTQPMVKMFHYFIDQPNMSNQNEAPLPG